MDSKVETKRERAVGPDIVRLIAIVFVIAVHFFLNCGYYVYPMVGKKMFLMTCFRWLFLICVPLFMLLTGYFKCQKTLSKSHYKAIIPVLVSYILIAVMKIKSEQILYGTQYDLKTGTFAVASYQMSWYVNMYIGMMFLIPFLNILWKGIPEKRERKLLVLSLLLLSAVPSVFPIIVSSYWAALYPITYYFIGAYIREYQPRIKIMHACFALAAVIIYLAASTFHLSGKAFFTWHIAGTLDSAMNALPVAICAVIVFLLFYQVQIKSVWVKKILGIIASLSLNMYLFSGIFDAIIFQYLKRTLVIPEEFIPYFFITVPFSFFASLLCAFILDKLVKWIGMLLHMVVYSIIKQT